MYFAFHSSHGSWTIARERPRPLHSVDRAGPAALGPATARSTVGGGAASLACAAGGDGYGDNGGGRRLGVSEPTDERNPRAAPGVSIDRHRRA